MLKIEGGTYKDYRGIWRYPYSTKEGYFIQEFTAGPDEVPEIGDFIEEGVLVKRQGYQSNQDHSKWDYGIPDLEVWGRDR